MNKRTFLCLLLCAVFILAAGCNVCSHTWVDATCLQPKTCSLCGATRGNIVAHKFFEWRVAEEATCVSAGVDERECLTCGEKETRTIYGALREHTPGSWTTTRKATLEETGERVKKCTVCGEVVETEYFQLSDAEREAQTRAACVAYTYDQIARNPAAYVGTFGKYTGEVIQVIEGSDNYIELRVNITPGAYGYTDTIYVTYRLKSGEPRILDGDIITIYGMNLDTISYQTVLGATITIPWVMADYID